MKAGLHRNIRDPQLCDECHQREASSLLILTAELQRGRTIRRHVCDRCALEVATDDQRQAARRR